MSFSRPQNLIETNVRILFNVEKVIKGHTSSVTNILYFKKHNQMVSLSYDKSIRIWDSRKHRCEQLVGGGLIVNCMVKWDEDSFLIACGDSTIRTLFVGEKDVNINKNVIKLDFDSHETILTMMKMPRNIILLVTNQNEVKLMSYKRGIILKSHGSLHMRLDKINIVKSKKWENRIYVTSTPPPYRYLKRRRGDVVKLVKFHPFFHVEQVFQRHNTEESQKSLSLLLVYLNYLNEEIVVTGDEKTIYIYDTSIPAKSNNLVMKLTIENVLFSSITSLSRRYLCIGDAGGRFFIVNLTKFLKPKFYYRNPVTEIVSICNQLRTVHLFQYESLVGNVFTKGSGGGPISNFFDLTALSSNRYMKMIATCPTSKAFKIVSLSLFDDDDMRKCARYVNSKIGELVKKELSSGYVEDNERRETFGNLERVMMERINISFPQFHKLNTPEDTDEFQSLLHELSKSYVKHHPNLFFTTEDNFCFENTSENSSISSSNVEPPTNNFTSTSRSPPTSPNHPNMEYLYFGQINMEGVAPILEPHGFGILFERLQKTKSINLFTRLKKRSKKKSTKDVYFPKYVGEFQFGRKWGTGKLFGIQKSQRHLAYSGEFINGFRDGKGMEFTKTKKHHSLMKTFEGQYRAGRRHGRGSEKVVKGCWKEGVLDEKSIFSFKCPIINYEEIGEHLSASRLIASGANGNIYKLETSLLPESMSSMGIQGEYVAVKLMSLRGGMFEKKMMFNMIKRGIELCHRISNVAQKNVEKNHVVNIFAIFTGFKEIGYIMDLCKFSVNHVITTSQWSLSIEEKKRIIFETALGMKSLHQHNIMHRDLKWPNVLVDFDGTIKLTDFDTLKEDERIWRMDSLPATSSIAPEVFLGKKHRIESDVYAFGLMIYSLIFEVNHPFSTQFKCYCGNSVENIIQSNTLDYHVAHCELRPHLDPKAITKYPRFIIDLLVQCWDIDPYKRPSFSDIVQVFTNEQKKKKCYTILQLRFPEHQGEKKNQQLSMLLVEPKYDKIKEWIERKFRGSKVTRLSHSIFGSIMNDEDVFNLINKLEHHIINVTLDKYPSSSSSSGDNKGGKGELNNCSIVDEDEESIKKKFENLEFSEIVSEVKRLRKRCEKMEQKKQEILKAWREEVVGLRNTIQEYSKRNEKLEKRVKELESSSSSSVVDVKDSIVKECLEETEGEDD